MKCKECGTDANKEILYLNDGNWICYGCLTEMEIAYNHGFDKGRKQLRDELTDHFEKE